jgi:class 3 adenylate cyclase
MEPLPAAPGGRTLICTVVFADIVGYSQEPVSRQVQIKTRLNGIVQEALAHLSEAERIVLDTGDGVALCFLGDPEDALFAANGLRDAVLTEGGGGALRLRIGVNLGPVRIVRDVNGNRNVIGDGINVAQRIMSFAEPNQILVSRSYYEVVSRLSEEYARLFHYSGLHRDKHVRQHEVYEVNLARAGVAGSPPATSGTVPVDVPGGDGVPPAGGQFTPELLARVTALLAEQAGPVAKLVVRRAAAGAADLAALCQALAETLPGEAREPFLHRAASLGPSLPAPAGGGSPAPGGAAPAAAPAPVAPETLARVEARLAEHVGPIARVLVRQAARQAGSLPGLVAALAPHVPEGQGRDAFLAEFGRPLRAP